MRIEAWFDSRSEPLDEALHGSLDDPLMDSLVKLYRQSNGRSKMT
jgi:hypothetical protein